MVLPNFLLFDILPGVLRPRSDANCLQPSVAEVGRLRLALDGFNADISRMSSREWLESVSGRQGDGIFNLPMKLFPNIRDHERKWNDLKSRASGVINGMIEGDFRVLLTMDGHLRFVYAFLSELLRRGIDADEWTIILMDINSVVDEWHDLFCPANVRHSCGDILATKIEPDTALYLNFCGLGGMAAHVLKCVTEHAPQRPVFLSLSRRGMVPFFGSLWDLTQAIHNMLPPSGPIVIGWQKGAQDFITYRLTPPPIGAQPVDAFREQLPVVAQVPLDFNQASTAEMQNLRQLGPATADKIALERKVRPFRSMLDLRNRIFPSCRNGSKTVDLWERQGARVPRRLVAA